MKNLKFRFYDKTEKIMKYFDGIWNMPDPDYDFDEIQQFTGLVDRLGKEIWEGDIVSDGYHEKYGRYETKWDKIGWNFVSEDGREIEVIGNIYENNSLLKEQL